MRDDPGQWTGIKISNLRSEYRGSRKHVLDWLEQPTFVDELLQLAAPVDCRRRSDTIWLPRGYESVSEARLESFGPHAMPGDPAWAELRNWWLAHPAGANTPNWDLALNCDIEGKHGLILVEAKANVPELSHAGKPKPKPRTVNGVIVDPSAASVANHARIQQALLEAREGLSAQMPGIQIDRDKSYQLSNRLAFAWKLASLGIPVVLIYLGFWGDHGISDAGEPFSHANHWRETFGTHLAKVWPERSDAERFRVGPADFWLLVRALEVRGQSPPRKRRIMAELTTEQE